MAGGFCKRANRHEMFGDGYVSAGHPLFVAAADRLRHAERALSYRAQPPSTSRRREPQHAGQPAAAGAVEAAAPGGGGKVKTRGMAYRKYGTRLRLREVLAVYGRYRPATPPNSAGLPPVKPLTLERGGFFSRKGGRPES